MRFQQRLRLIIGEYLRERFFLFILVAILFLMGLIFGALASGAQGADQELALLNYIRQGIREEVLLPNHLYTRQTVVANLETVFFLFFMGISVIGVPLALLLVFARGFILGFSGGFLVHSMGFKGLLLIVTGIIPHNLLVIPALFLMLMALMDCAAALTKIRFTKKQVSIGEELVKCSILTIIVLLVMVVAGLFQGYVTPVLMTWVKNIV